VKAVVRKLFWLADVLLDRVPDYEDGRWYWNGQWGCRLHLHRYWWPEEEVTPEFRSGKDGRSGVL
jgi:hypothetical protein